MEIKTHRINPPIGSRQFDWMAVWDNYDEGDPIGFGSTEEEAVQNLEYDIDTPPEESNP